MKANIFMPFLVLYLLFTLHTAANQIKPVLSSDIMVVISGLKVNQPNILLQVSSWNDFVPQYPVNYDLQVLKSTVIWRTSTNKALRVSIASLFQKGRTLDLDLDPGDSLCIDMKTGQPRFSGKGAEKAQFDIEYREALSKLKKPGIQFKPVASQEEFLEWMTYYEKNTVILEKILNEHRSVFSAAGFEKLKVNYLWRPLSSRISKYAEFKNLKHISLDTLNAYYARFIAENKYYNWLNEQKKDFAPIDYYYDLIKWHYLSHVNGIRYNNDELKKYVGFYELGDRLFDGELRKKVIANVLMESAFRTNKYIGGNEMKKRFYASLGRNDTLYINAIERYEDSRHKKNAEGKRPDFNGFYVLNANGDTISGKVFNNKILVLNAVSEVAQLDNMSADLLKEIGLFFRNDTGVVIANVICNNLPVNTLKPEAGNDRSPVKTFYAPDEKNTLSFKRMFMLTDFPALYILDGKQKLVYTSLRANEKPGTNQIIEIVSLQKAILNDGPYVFHKYQQPSKVITVKGNIIETESLSLEDKKTFDVGTDIDMAYFPLKLKQKNDTESSVLHKRPESLFVLSDIEGEFKSFRKLLQSNKIIDANFNWAFGKGHLVFAGDMFDRGLQVTECLWLIYSLEEKAKAAGGYIHFILGNHEIMNLQGNHRYVKDKYSNNAALMGKTLTQLYNEDSELGRWLRTKNIVERIGDLLFAHGGISSEMSKLKLSVEEINKLARSNYAYQKYDDKNLSTNIIMSSTYGPFWFRGYYKDPITESSLDSIMNNFKVKHIITGHTIIADTISVLYNGKVINTDTKHKAGKSEALLIEGNNFYRVNAEGKRVLLFRDETNEKTK